jgi:phenylalanyl-tRNA synthetase alpha chain
VHLPPHHYALIAALAAAEGQPSIERLAADSGTDQAQLTAAAVELEREGLLAIAEQDYLEVKLTDAGRDIASGRHSLPERRIAKALRALGGSAGIKQLMEQPLIKHGGLEPGRYARGLSELGWADFDRGTLSLKDGAATGDPPAAPVEDLLRQVLQGGGEIEVGLEQDAPAVAQLRSRKDYAGVRERTRRLLTLTPSGADVVAAFQRGEVTELREVNELTPEMLADGTWRAASFRAYDVTLAAETQVPGKPHPMSRLIEEVRRAFLALGFSEANCPMAESAFWDFDALFQPQDHPAREMQDTLYLSHPKRFALPDPALVEAVRAVHESGGSTGSLGWRYAWSAERAAQVVLRTHMTASSVLALAADPHPPRKVFSIGRVFRRETVDNTHLPEFTQVDGIIIDEHANLASLLGTLSTFYQRMGIDDIKMKPAFFPYTEPSVEVHIKWAGKWMEMGGAGIFRPEVTEPLGCKVPVLAWGLGLERLAMARFGLSVIKDLYQPRLDWLRDAPLNS